MLRLCRLQATLLLVCSGVLFAQSDRGNITGTISDPADAVVTNASVVATNSETGAQFRTVSTTTGNYTISSLPSGTYDLGVEVAGFKKRSEERRVGKECRWGGAKGDVDEEGRWW